MKVNLENTKKEWNDRERIHRRTRENAEIDEHGYLQLLVSSWNLQSLLLQLPRLFSKDQGSKTIDQIRRMRKRSFKYDSKSSRFCDSFEKQLSYFIIVTLKRTALYSSVSHLANTGCLCASAALERKLSAQVLLKNPKQVLFDPSHARARLKNLQYQREMFE